MAATTKWGAICLNGTVVRETCENCLWYEWDDVAKTCLNRQEPICPLFLSDVFTGQDRRPS
jgi:hypothetical protein